MTIDESKIIRCMNRYLERIESGIKTDRFFLAICYLKLGDFNKAKNLFSQALYDMFEPRSLWKGAGQPQWLVDACVLSGNRDKYQDIHQDLEQYRIEKRPPQAYSYVALYSYGLIELLSPTGYDIEQSIKGLIAKPKLKDGYAMGQVFRAILDKDDLGVNEGLMNLLKVHEGVAKHGGLRWSSEGFLCMPAMSLAYAARLRNMQVSIENDYFSMEYLNYILSTQM